MEILQALRVRNRVAEALAKSMSNALTPFLGRELSQALLGRLGAVTRPQVSAARDKLQKLARVQYLDFVADKNPIRDPKLSRFTEESWAATIEKVTSDEEESFTEDHLEMLVRKGDFWARDAERGALIDYALNDKRIGRWARIDPEPPSCPWCTLQISRGAIFHSDLTALSHFHTGCTCSVVLVKPGEEDSFPGVELRDAALAEYKDALEVTGGNTGISEVIKAMKEKRGDTGKSPGKTSGTKDKAISEQSAKLAQAQARRKTLDRIKPRNDAQRTYRDKQIQKEDRVIRDLTKQLDTLKGAKP